MATTTALTSARSSATTTSSTAKWTSGLTVKRSALSPQSQLPSSQMLTAVILVKSSREGLGTLGPKLADVEGVAEVYTVTGGWGFVAVVRVREHDDLAKVVTHELAKLEGIERTQTMVAFQQFSAHDLEAMFGLGLGDKT